MLDFPMAPAAGRKRNRRKKGQEGGFVLLVVLSTLGLLALVVATFAHVARGQVKAAAAYVESARAEALADAGVNLAIFDVVSAREGERPGARSNLGAAGRACSIDDGAGVLSIAVQDEAGKVDLNIASEALLRALVLGAGVGGGEAAVDAILDFRDADDNRRPSGAERAEYRAAGRSDGPKNGAFLAIEELTSVLGLTQADLERLRPFVTLHSGQMGIDPNAASPALLEVLSRGVRDSGLAFKSPEGNLAKFPSTGAPLPEELMGGSVLRAFSVRSEARMQSGAVFVREAVVELGAARSALYIVRRWSRAPSLVENTFSQVTGTPPPPC